MKTRKVLMIVILLLTTAWPATGQSTGEWRVYIPFVARERSMSDWKIVVPESGTNYTENPSGEIAGNFTQLPGTTVTRVTTYSFFGLRSYRIQTNANNEGISFVLSALPAAVAYVTLRVRGTLPAAWDMSLDNATYRTPTLIESIDADWDLYGVAFPVLEAGGSVVLYVRQNGAGTGDFYLDAVQVESGNAYWTTYIDGDQDGCEWLGTPHASASQRSAQSRAGGRVRDLQDDYGFMIGNMIDVGFPPVSLSVDSYALLPGGELNALKVQSRSFALTGVLQGTSVADLHAKRQALLNVLKPGAVPGDQPVRIRYTGAAVQKQIAAYYEGGLETSIDARLMCWERLAIRFLADDPYWYEIGESAQILDNNDTATVYYMAGRLRSTGQWDDMSLTAIPVANGIIYDVVVGPDGNIYVGGNFTGLNNTLGAASIDYVGMYNPNTGVWSQVGVAGDFTGVVYALTFGPDGTLYAGGAFNVAGGSTCDHLAEWNGAVWATVGNPLLGGAVITMVWHLTFDNAGNLYAAGDFFTWNNIAGADGVVMWTAAGAYAAVGGGVALGGGELMRAVTIDSQGNVYVGGTFLNYGGTGANYIAMYDATAAAWQALGGSLSAQVWTLVTANDDTIYIGGFFQNAGGDTNADCICTWNGAAFAPLGTGLNNICYKIHIAPDGMVYAGGVFTVAGGITLADRLAKWNGSSWAHLDIDLPGAGVVYDIATGGQDPVVEQNYDLWIGHTTTGAAFFAGDTAVTNAGTEAAYPRIIVNRSGGTLSRLEEVRNETIGKELLFDYSLLDGEELIVDLTPTDKSIVSNFFGSRLDAILANSDFGSFVLQPGSNLVTAFVAITGATVESYLIWKDTYWSSD